MSFKLSEWKQKLDNTNREYIESEKSQINKMETVFLNSKALESKSCDFNVLFGSTDWVVLYK